MLHFCTMGLPFVKDNLLNRFMISILHEVFLFITTRKHFRHELNMMGALVIKI